VPWSQGINPEMVREYWATQADVPYELRKLPPHIARRVHNHRAMKSYKLETRKLVVYKRERPELRLVLLLGERVEGEDWQPIQGTRIERDGNIDPKTSRQGEEQLWDEVCKVERRGRPRGTGHPKRPAPAFPLDAKNISRLRKAGLDDRDLRILFGRWERKTFKQIAQAVGNISTQAVWKRWQTRIEPAIKQVNPKFSRGSLNVLLN